MTRKRKHTAERLQDTLNRLLVGKQIVDAFYADDGDHELVIVLPGDAALTVQRDEEGNGPGALHHLTSKKGRTELVVIPGSATRA
jgi:hypothetical protein